MVEDYEYLGIHITNRQTNTEAVHKRGRKLTSFTVCSRMMALLSPLILAAEAYFPEQHKHIRKSRSVIGCKLETLEGVMDRRSLDKLLSITDHSDHPLHYTLTSSLI